MTTDTPPKKTPTPRMPGKLGPRGKRLWRRAIREFEFNVAELEILEQACRLSDLVERLNVAVGAESLLVEGSRGNMVANPLLYSLRQERALYRQYLASLGLPEDDDSRSWDGISASERARRASLARWRK